jgi:PAS domain S-box-containing protein
MSADVNLRPLPVGASPEARIGALEWALGPSPSAALAFTDGRIFYINDAARSRWPSLAPGSPLASLFAEDERERIEAVVAGLGAHGVVAEFQTLEHDVARGQRWGRFELSPLRNGDGEGSTSFLCIVSDIAGLKLTEQRLRRSEQLMVDTQGVAHLGTWEWDVSEPTAVWSDELYRIYGLTRETYTPSYEGYLRMVHPDDRQRVIDATNRVFHEHVPYSHDERIFRPDGSMRYLHTWAQPMLDGAGTLVRLLGVCQDITDQKLAEEQVRELNLDLERRVAERTRTIEQSLRDVEAFNAMVSHDLRAPLQVIAMSCQLMAREAGNSLPATFGDHLARVQRASTHMTQLVTDLLALSHVGNAQLERSEVDLSTLAGDIMANLRRLAPEREATVEIEPGLRCAADPVLLRSALENLLGNAWKYSARAGHARIAVGRITVDGRAQIFVRDNGAGFDAPDPSEVFKPFTRFHKPSEFAGTGVGLAIVQRIVERHGGRIHAHGRPGQGATFTFDFGG